MDHKNKSLDEPSALNFSPYLLLSETPEHAELEMTPSYRFVRCTLLTRIIPLLNLALLVTVFLAFDRSDLEPRHIIYMTLLLIIPFVLAVQSACTRIDISSGLIRQTMRNGFGTRNREYTIEPGHRVEVRSTRGRASNWQFSLINGNSSVTLFHIPSSTRLWPNLAHQEESKRNFMDLLQRRLNIPVVDTDAPKP